MANTDGDIQIINVELTPKIDANALQKETNRLKKSLDSIAKDTKGVPTLEKGREQATRLSKSMDGLQRQLNKAYSQKVVNEDYTKIVQQISALEKELAKTEKQLPSIKAKAEQATKAAEKQVATLESKAKAAETEVAKLQQALQNAANVQSKSDAFAQLEKELASWENKRSQAEARVAKMEKLGTDKLNNGNYSKAYDSALYDFDKADDEIKRIKAQMQQLVNAGQHIKIGDPKEYARIQQQLSVATQKSSELNANLAQAKLDKDATVSNFTNELNNAQASADSMRLELEQLNAEKREWETGNRGKIVDFAHPEQVEALGQALAVTHDKAERLGNTLKGMKIANTVFKSITQGAKSVAATVSKMFHSMSKNSDANRKHMMRNFIQYVLGFRSLFFLVRRLRKTIIDAFGTMAKSIPEVNVTISNLYNTFNQLKGSLGTALQPILSALAPALTTIMNLAIGAANAVGTFFATLTGQGVIYKATKGNVDYAASLDKSTKAAGKQADAQDKLNEKLGEYDKLSVIKDDKDKDKSSGSGSSGGADDGTTFTTETIDADSKISQLAAKLRAAWQAQDWAGLGTIIGTTINNLVGKITTALDWKTCGPKITSFITNVATAFNSLVDTIDWAGLGTMFSTGINTLINTANLVVTKIKWTTLAGNIGTMLSSAINGINWANLGTLLSNLVKTALASLSSAVKNFNWRELGTNIAKFLKSIDWPGIAANLADAVGDLIIAALDTLDGFLDEYDWETLATTIEDSLVAFITTFKWGTIFEKLLNVIISGIWGGIKTFFSALGQPLTLLLNALFEAYGTPEAKKELKKAGGDIVGGLWEGIAAPFKFCYKWVKEHMINPFIESFKKLMGIASPSKVMKKLGGYIVDGLKAGIGNIWGKVKEKFTNMLKNVKDWFSKKKEDVSKAWGKFTSGVKDVTAKIKGKIDKTFTNAKEKWDSIKDKARTLVANAKEKVHGALQKLKEGWQNIDNKTAVLGAELKKGLSDTVGKWWGNIKDWFNGGNGNSNAPDRKFEASMDKPVEQSTVENWWENIKSWFGTGNKLKVDTEANVNDIKVDDSAKSVQDWKNTTFTKGAKVDTITDTDAKAAWKKNKFEKGALVNDVTTKKEARTNWQSKKFEKGALVNDVTTKKEAREDWQSKKFEKGAKVTSITTDSTVKTNWQNKPYTTSAVITSITTEPSAKAKLASSLTWQAKLKRSGGSYGDTVTLELMKRGGVVTSPTFAMIGEDGPEAVVPLKNNTEWLDKVSNYVVSHLALKGTQLPKLATGHVIPPNREFLAMLGDQKQGVNIESPLATIEQALENVFEKYLGQTQQPVYVQLNGRTIAEAVFNEQRKRARQTV